MVEGGLNDYDQPAAAIDRGFRELMADLVGHHVVVVGPADAPLRSAPCPGSTTCWQELADRTASPTSARATSTWTTCDDRLHLTEDGHREFGDASRTVTAVTRRRSARPHDRR